MEFQVEKKLLVEGLGWVQSLVEKRSTMPILANTLIKAESDFLKIVATDLQVGIEGKIPANVNKKGAITLHARKLFDIIKEMPEGEIKITVDESLRAEISGKKGIFHLVGTNEQEYPPLPEFSKDKFVNINAKTFSEMVDKTIYACSLEETRYNLGGVFCHVPDKEKMLRMVATDGHRLCLVDREIEGASKLDLKKGVVLPRKGLSELKKLIKEDIEDLSVSLSGNNVVFMAGDLLLSMRILEGDYPDYKRVLPTDNKLVATVDRVQMVESLRRVSVISEEKTRGVKFSFKKDMLILESQNPELGDAKEEVEVDYKGSALDIGFNARYVLETFAAMNGEKVKMQFKDNLSSGLFQSVEDSNYLCVIMPMRL